MMTPTIGACMVEYGDLSTPDRRRAALHPSAAAAGPPAQSLLLQAAAAAATTDDSRTLFVTGPPKSGRSSLAMDAAYSIASSSSSQALCRQHCEGPCRCVAATLIVPAVSQDALFPLYCQQSVSTNTNSKEQGEPSFQVQMQQLQQSKQTHYQPHVLQRIQVRHVASVHCLLTYLLTVQGLPAEEQPWGGIVVDSLDRLVESSFQQHGSSADVANQTMMLSQVVALLIDTMNCLERTHGSESCQPRLLVTSDTPSSPRLTNVWKSLLPNHLALSPQTGSVRSWQGLLRPEEAVVSTWGVARESTANKNSSNTGNAIEYAMVRGLDSSLRIVWTEHAGDATTPVRG